MDRIARAGLLGLIVLAFSGCSDSPSAETAASSVEEHVDQATIAEPSADDTQELLAEYPVTGEAPEEFGVADPDVELHEGDLQLQELLDALVGPDGTYDIEVALKIQERGAETMPLLLERAFNAAHHIQMHYAHVLYRIDVEPDRFEALKKIINEHPDLSIRARAVDSLTRQGHPEEAIDLVIEMTGNKESLIRYTAYRTLRFAEHPNRNQDICEVLRQGLKDPDQTTRETAQRSIDELRERRITCE